MTTSILKSTSRGIETVHTEDQLYSERKIFFTEEVNAYSAAELIRLLSYLEKTGPKEEIGLYINSPGGEVSSGLAVYDVISGLTCPVRTVCIGTAASMAAILFLAGSVREMLPHSKIMIHDPLIDGLSGVRRALQLEKDAQKLMKSRDILGGIIAERTGHTLEEVFELTGYDCYLDAEEALQFGIATEIVNHFT